MWGGYSRSICLLLKIQLFKFNFSSHSQSSPACSLRLFIGSLNLPAPEPEVTGFSSTRPRGGLPLYYRCYTQVLGARSPKMKETETQPLRCPCLVDRGAQCWAAVLCEKHRRHSNGRRQRRGWSTPCCGHEAPPLYHASWQNTQHWAETDLRASQPKPNEVAPAPHRARVDCLA